MIFLGYPIEIWLAAVVSVLIRFKYNQISTVLGSITSIVVAIFAGVFMHEPLMALFGINSEWAIFTAIVISLTAENFLKSIMEISEDREFIKEWIKHMLTKGPRK
jgi:hypothetical protein